jgi:CheY-like chemotaxis protein/HPt (histidine-containing phosphotransfer) domain-containing protein
LLVRIVVQDTGIGLNESAKQRLFQPFSQADSSTTRKYGGTGLGLSICKRLVEAMGGEIGVDSVPGVGSSFWAQIPLEVVVGKALPVPAESTLRGKKVLIAGDTAGFQAILGASFEAWQMDYEAVVGMAELRARLAQQTSYGKGPDLLLLGYPLPDASLLEAVAALRQDGSSAPVCCLPHQGDRELKSELLAQGAIVMHKPIKQSSLLDAMMASLFRAQSELPAMTTLAVNRPRSSRHRLLLAEDNAVNQRVAVHILNKLGYGVDVVENGAMAVEAVVRGSYSLVLMDCQMPVMDGFAATKAIRQAEEKTAKHLPILAMTANAMQGDRELCLTAGMDDYITKPIDTARLAATLATWLKDEIAIATPSIPVRAPLAAAKPVEQAIDLKRLTELVGDSPGAIDDMLLAFAKYLQPLQERLTTQVRDAGPDLKALLHELRGAASNLGANPLAQLASDLETGLAGGERAPVALQIARIDAEFKRVLDYLDRGSSHQLP